MQIKPVADPNCAKDLKSKEQVLDKTALSDSFFPLGNEYVKRANALLKRDEDGLERVGGKVYVFPSLQLPPIKFYEDEEVMCKLLETAAQRCSRIKLASGYLNLPKSFSERLFSAKCPIDLMAASPKANGFYESGFFKRWIPILYRCFEYYLLKDLKANATLYEYVKENWTYHGKGSWYYEGESRPSMTIIGSSNYGICVSDCSEEIDKERHCVPVLLLLLVSCIQKRIGKGSEIYICELSEGCFCDDKERQASEARSLYSSDIQAV
eukprot:TRINITY_DN458_c0_g3_i1.p1 TRINITY_DN458_c0_g3~~TRINITY_DN458_c0_g3_i1.p1  ORF type:complete len:267 (+),score=22.67 TRINITY_DN458_c0_g3_i1:944-1744(+)